MSETLVKYGLRALAITVAVALSAAAAATARADDGDEVVATRADPAQAPSTAATAPVPAPAPAAAPMTTDQQIKAWLSQPAPVSRMSRDDVEPWTDAPTVVDGRPHGEVGATLGTGGARGFYGTVNVPLGKTGSATLSYAEGHKLPAYGYGAYGGGWSPYPGVMRCGPAPGAPCADPRFAGYAPW